MLQYRKEIHTIGYGVFAAVPVGIMVGFASALFLYFLDWATLWYQRTSLMYLGLPLAGILIGWIYYRYGSVAARGIGLLRAVFSGQTKDSVPFRMAPLVFFGTIVTHIFGGSAGREGTAVQVGAVLSLSLKPWFRKTPVDAQLLIGLGVASGFSGVFGTPIAGLVFAFELFSGKQHFVRGLLPTLVAVWLADKTCMATGILHTQYNPGLLPIPDSIAWLWLIPIAFLFGAMALFFHRFTGGVAQLFEKIKPPFLRPLIGGVLLVLLFAIPGTQSYSGLGISGISKAFNGDAEPFAFFFKSIFTALTLGSGFKGGEATPLFFIGATLGATVGNLTFFPVGFLAALGFCAVFGAAVRVPLASAVMGMELFGYGWGLYLLPVCVLAYYAGPSKGAYGRGWISRPFMNNRET
jgi:H+/Cl- antiporter ClcA